jgi:alpha-beta hydrolase superfamily lysophospholipase
MKPSRRAVPRDVDPRLVAGVRTAAIALGGALVAVTGAMAVASVAMARRVVTPSVRTPDTRIVDLDVAAQTITLGSTPDTRLPGRYGLFTSGTQSYVKLGTVLAQDASTVKRKLLTEVPSDAHLAAEAGFSGWDYDDPDQLHLPYTDALVGTSAGICPAWLFPGDSDTWVIQVHGRGTTRAECLRAVPVFHALGMPVLVASYRNDGEGARTRGGRYALGTTEWRDIDAAIGFAVRAGARRVVLMGWSMGGAIVLQTALNAARRDVIAGIVLESPVVDWRSVLQFQARQMHLPDVVTSLALGTLESEWTSPLARTAPISFDRLDVVARAGELQHPILLMHSDDDGFVPADASHALAAARPDLVDMEVFTGARHTKLWNYDQNRWSEAIADWLERTGISARDQTAD